jgi:hypothetical protein
MFHLHSIYPPLHLMGTEVLSQGVGWYTCPGRKADHLLQVPRLRMNGVAPLIHQYAFMSSTGTILPLTAVPFLSLLYNTQNIIQHFSSDLLFCFKSLTGSIITAARCKFVATCKCGIQL